MMPDLTHPADRWTWEVATDYVLAGFYVTNGMPLPHTLVHDPRFNGMTQAEIFDILVSERY